MAVVGGEVRSLLRCSKYRGWGEWHCRSGGGGGVVVWGYTFGGSSGVGVFVCLCVVCVGLWCPSMCGGIAVGRCPLGRW